MAMVGLLMTMWLVPLAHATTRASDCVEPREYAVAQLINQERAARHLRALYISDVLSASSEHMVQDMSHYGQYEHELHDGTPWNTNQRNHGYTYNTWRGQVIALGRDTPTQVVHDWMASPTHRPILLSPDAVVLGVGYTRGRDGRRWWTVDFGGYADAHANRCG
jgi:uncharacterized protein YkwD